MSKYLWITIAIVFLLVVGIGDLYFVPNGVSVSLLYLIPIGLASWFASATAGAAIAVASAVIWLADDLLHSPPAPHPVILLWNTIVRLVFFGLMVLAIRLAKAHDFQRAIARTDFLTGAFNSRFFTTLAQREMSRSERYAHPFTVAYLDLDNFKLLNDTLGHTAGNQCLQVIVATMQAHLRRVDMLARIGGDEFAVLLPETGQKAAKAVVEKIKDSLLTQMRNSEWPVTVSIGVLTCLKPPATVEDMLHKVDAQMYCAKRSGKNSISYAIYAG